MKTGESGVRFGVRFLSRSFFFSLSSAHCLVFGFVCNWHLTLHLIIRSVCQDVKTALIFSGLLVFRRKKKQNVAGFSGANSRKNQPILQEMSEAGLLIFRGKKSKISRDFQGQIRGKIGRFRGEKSQNSQKNRSILRDFSGKKVNFRRIFRGKFLEKSADKY